MTGVYPLGGGGSGRRACAEAEVLEAAAAVEARSEHPLAGAILDYARGAGVWRCRRPESSSPCPAAAPPPCWRAASCSWATTACSRRWAGAPRRVEALLERLESEGQTAVLVGRDGAVLGAVAVADQPREGARRALAELKRVGVRRTLMLTGDNRATARAVAAELGVDEVRAELLPQDKVAAVRELAARHGGVAMVGDGVNDAPALAAATVGIAMGAAGADAALETADVALMSDDLTRLPAAVRLSRRVGGIVRQNILFALLVKVVFIALTPLGSPACGWRWRRTWAPACW